VDRIPAKRGIRHLVQGFGPRAVFDAAPGINRSENHNAPSYDLHIKKFPEPTPLHVTMQGILETECRLPCNMLYD